MFGADGPIPKAARADSAFFVDVNQGLFRSTQKEHSDSFQNEFECAVWSFGAEYSTTIGVWPT
jgi:hypothetical protein